VSDNPVNQVPWPGLKATMMGEESAQGIGAPDTQTTDVNQIIDTNTQSPRTVTPLIQSQDFEVTSASLNTALGWLAHSIIVDNPTTSWLYLQNINRYVGPGVMQCIIPIESGTQVAQAKFQAPPGVTNPGLYHATNAHVVYTSKLYMPCPGYAPIPGGS